MAKGITKAQRELYANVEARPEHELVMNRILAGSAKFTLTSTKTGKRLTYWIRTGAQDRQKNWSTSNQNRSFYFVKLLTGPDNTASYEWIGSLRRTDSDSKAISFQVSNDKWKTAPARFAIEWWLHKIFTVGVIPDDVEVDWMTTCARCGRELTVPESIRSGYGPECIAHA